MLATRDAHSKLAHQCCTCRPGERGCFGNSLQRSADPTRLLVVNLGANRYVYSAVQYEQLPPAPTLARPARGSQQGEREIATISVRAEYGGFGTGGLRSGAGQFYPELAEVSAALGGPHFAVVDATAGSDGTIRGLTALVLLRAPQLR